MSEESVIRALKASNEGKQELIDDCLKEIGEKRTKIILLEETVKRYQVYNHNKYLMVLKLKGLLEKERRLREVKRK